MCLYSGIVLQQEQKYYSIKTEGVTAASGSVIIMSVPVFWYDNYHCIYGRFSDI